MDEPACRTCIALQAQIDFLQGQVRGLQEALVNLADPMALGRQAQAARIAAGDYAPGRAPNPLPPRMNARQAMRAMVDRPSAEELERLAQMVKAEKVESGPSEIERSFEVTSAG